jgi:hypothetical protein
MSVTAASLLIHRIRPTGTAADSEGKKRDGCLVWTCVSISPGFRRFAAICAFASAITTLGIHLLPTLLPAARTLEEAARLHDHPIHIARLWIVILHVWIVFVAAWAAALLLAPRALGWAGLGLFGYGVFTIAELTRTCLALFAVNRWRAAFLDPGTPETVRASLRTLLEGWPGVGLGLFAVFGIGFLVGNLSLGIAAAGGRGLERAVGIVLLAWAGYSFAGLLAESLRTSGPPSWLAFTFQPAARALLGVWIWKAPGSLTARPDP